MSMTSYKAQVDDLKDEIAELREDMAHVTAVEAGCSSIVIDWQEIGGIRIGLDAVGNAVRVEFPDNLNNMYGWDMEA